VQIPWEWDGKVYGGTVIKIYPGKKSIELMGKMFYQWTYKHRLRKLPSTVSRVSVLIASNTGSDVILIPSWVVLGHEYVWDAAKR